MNAELRDRLIHMVLSLKRMRPPFFVDTDLPTGEMITLHKIAFMQFRSEARQPNDAETSVSDIHEEMNVSRPAVSQTLNSLEKKGLISREIGKDDRRKIIVTVTPEGDRLLLDFRRRSDMVLDEIIERFGASDMREFLDKCDELVEIAREVRKEHIGER